LSLLGNKYPSLDITIDHPMITILKPSSNEQLSYVQLQNLWSIVNYFLNSTPNRLDRENHYIHKHN